MVLTIRDENKTTATWLFLGLGQLSAQSQHLEGLVLTMAEPCLRSKSFVLILSFSTESNGEGKFRFGPIPVGLHTIRCFFGRICNTIHCGGIGRDLTLILNFDLKSDNVVEEVVVTGTKTFQRKTTHPFLSIFYLVSQWTMFKPAT